MGHISRFAGQCKISLTALYLHTRESMMALDSFHSTFGSVHAVGVHDARFQPSTGCYVGFFYGTTTVSLLGLQATLWPGEAS